MAKHLPLDKILDNPTNIAGFLDEHVLGDYYDYCWTRYKDLVSARTPRNEKLKEANKEALQLYEKKEYPWKDAANVKFPLITNACIDFASRIYPAVWQDGDVAKSKFYNESPNYQAGKRLATYLNYCLAERIPGWSQNLDKLCAAMPVNGLMLKKVYYDPEIATVRSDLVFPQDMFVPNEAATLQEASYYFQRMVRKRRDIVGYLRSGLWCGIEEEDLDQEGDQVVDTEAKVRDEDLQPSAQSDTFEVVEGYAYFDIDGDGYSEPYIITFLPKLSKIVRIVPRFDDSCISRINKGEKQIIYRIDPFDFFVEFPFMQSLDGSIYALGLGELLLPINQAVDTTINQLLDAGTLNNTNGGWISKNIRLPQGQTNHAPGEWKAVNTFTGKLADNILPLPKTEPSQTTFALLGMLRDAGASMAGAAQIKDIQIPSNLSATSSMAIIENGMTGLKSVYKRFHQAMTKELRLILGWLVRYPNLQEYVAIAGQEASEQDFALVGSIVPVSDPNLITTISKATKAQQLQEMAQQGLVDKTMASMQILDYAGIDPASVIPKEPSAAEKMAAAIQGAQLNLLKAQTMQALALALRAKDQGIGDLARANSETMARASKSMLDMKNASLKKEAKVVGDKVITQEVTDTTMFADELKALMDSVGISFGTPIGRVLGEKLGQSVEEGIQGAEDTEPNDVRVKMKTTIQNGGFDLDKS